LKNITLHFPSTITLFSFIVSSDVLEFSSIKQYDHYYIGKFLEARTFISKMETRPRQDFNQLFGFKYDPETQAPISGVSPQGKYTTNKLLSSP
jgi:phage-related protein